MINLIIRTGGANGGCYYNASAQLAHFTGKLKQSIASPSTASKLLANIAAMSGVGASAGGGGGEEPPEKTCDVFIGVVSVAPSGGFGSGKVKKVTFDSTGAWTAGTEEVTVIFPRI